jgi:ERCC4-type nuclease
MNHFDIEKCIESIQILVDTREQDTERARKRLTMLPCPHARIALSFGDYSYSFRQPNGLETPMGGKFAIERKMSLDELAACFTHDRGRFEREFERATDHGARMVLIIENASYENLVNHKYRSRLNPNAFLASLIAWENRYGLHTVMCKEETTPRIIYEWCKRDLKERLERGDY